MLALTNRLVFETTKAPEFIDITDDVVRFVRESRVQNGCVVIYSKHTTAAIKVNENEPLLIEDMERFLKRIAPQDANYRHNDFSIRTVNLEEDDCPNGHAHCQHLLMSTSETVPVIDGELQLGRWQRVFLVELDRPRSREVVLQALGE
ncbi:MAG: YjbQ family protein [Chloroflexi bacterium]|nr:YjbQ family protein [Chloroflexota bacterium]